MAQIIDGRGLAEKLQKKLAEKNGSPQRKDRSGSGLGSDCGGK